MASSTFARDRTFTIWHMGESILILIGAALTNNAVLTHLLGMDPALRSQGRLRVALTIAPTTGCVLLIAAAILALAFVGFAGMGRP